jgi:membrane-bound inhibitor of C-type lysozyme
MQLPYTAQAAMALGACALLFLSCNPGEDTTAQKEGEPELVEEVLVYDCQDGYTFTASFREASAWLFLPDGRSAELPIVPSGSGVRYESGDLLFWPEGDEATLESGDLKLSGCRSNPAKAIWESAKLGGVDFRAVGNEPGWDMEITWGEETVLVSNYGETTHRFRTPKPLQDQEDRTTTMAAVSGGIHFMVLLAGQPCFDSMSGEQFETTVTLTVGEKTLHGCGRDLH